MTLMFDLVAIFSDPANIAALATLIAMEVLLGIDNLIFISILTNKLPEHQRSKARRVGISGAFVLRLAFLSVVFLIVQLTEPVVTVLKLVPVPWLPKHGARKLMITSVNDVNEKLKAVSAELDELPERFVKYLTPSGGTYNCRVIAGTARPSVHGNGIAIDINVGWSDYWRNAQPVNGKYPYKNRIPWQIIEIFEKHGFIWGGKWYHYDTMHFEYRPELLP
jgi:hypothetical protein